MLSSYTVCITSTCKLTLVIVTEQQKLNVTKSYESYSRVTCQQNVLSIPYGLWQICPQQIVTLFVRFKLEIIFFDQENRKINLKDQK